jgi:hypothetical protein
MDDSLIKFYNRVYQEKGYHGIIRTLKRDLEFGDINFPSDNLLQVTTGGWSDDEDALSSLTSLTSMFGHNHYVGELRGGVFYFAEQMESTGAFEIIEKLPDRETCNPKICCWCKYSNNGMRDPARSITMCDGCRYNEEFEHI